MSIEGLADIASRCGTHSLGLVYEFLLKTVGNPKQARAHFVRFLSGGSRKRNCGSPKNKGGRLRDQSKTPWQQNTRAMPPASHRL
jgi:hypothetical protein